MPTIRVKMHEYVRVEKPDVPVEIPEVPVYYFQTGIRRAVRIVPEWTTWNKEQGKDEEIYNLKVTCVYRSGENRVETFSVPLHRFADYLGGGSSKDQCSIPLLLERGGDERTKEQFDEDLNAVLAEIAAAGR